MIAITGNRNKKTGSVTHIPHNVQGACDARAGSVVHEDLQGTHDAHARSVACIPQDLQGARAGSVLKDLQGAHDAHAKSAAPISQDLQGAGDEDEYWGDDDNFAGDETIIAGKGKDREVDIDMVPAPQSILSGMDVDVAGVDPTLDNQHTQGQSIPLNPNSIVAFYNTSATIKRGCDYDSESNESRQSKVHQHSTSHSAASAAPSAGQSVPSTKFTSRSGSVDNSDHYGASRATGGVFRGKATGNVMNWGDVGMYCLILNYFQVFNFLPFFRCNECRH